MKNKIAPQGFILFSLAYIIITLLGRADIAWYLKPFLLPFLMYWVYSFDSFPTKKILLLALTFSWIGDCILLFSDKGEMYFIVGLVAFLLSHLVYIAVFNKQIKTEINTNKFMFWSGIGIVLLYLLSMISLLIADLGDLKIPVIGYAITISVMLLYAFKGSLNWAKPSNFYILFGAILFVSSDSILAINKFHTAIHLASFWIMVTYLSAQFCITFGILQLNIKSRH
jgi:uncharacterized membrane protein YhhN